MAQGKWRCVMIPAQQQRRLSLRLCPCRCRKQLAQGCDLPTLKQSGQRTNVKRMLHREVRHTIRGAKLVGLVKVFKRALAKGSVP